MWDIETIVEDVDKVKKPDPIEHRGIKSLANNIHIRNQNEAKEGNANQENNNHQTLGISSFSPNYRLNSISSGINKNISSISQANKEFEELFPAEIPNSVQKSIFKQQFETQNVSVNSPMRSIEDPMKSQINYQEQAKAILKTKTTEIFGRKPLIQTPPPPRFPPSSTDTETKSNLNAISHNQLPPLFHNPPISINNKPQLNTPLNKPNTSFIPKQSGNTIYPIPEIKINPNASDAIRSQDIDCISPNIQKVSRNINQRLQNNPSFASRPQITLPPPPPPKPSPSEINPSIKNSSLNTGFSYPTPSTQTLNNQVKAPILLPSFKSPNQSNEANLRPNLDHNCCGSSLNFPLNPNPQVMEQNLDLFTPSFAEPKINQRPPENPAERNARVIELLNQMQKSNPSKLAVLNMLIDGNPHPEIEILRQIKKTRYIGSVAFGMMMFNLQEMFGKDMIKDEVRQGVKHYTLSSRFIDLCNVALQENSDS